MAAFPLSAVSGEGLRKEASRYIVMEKDRDPGDVSPFLDRDSTPIWRQGRGCPLLPPLGHVFLPVPLLRIAESLKPQGWLCGTPGSGERVCVYFLSSLLRIHFVCFRGNDKRGSQAPLCIRADAVETRLGALLRPPGKGRRLRDDRDIAP